MQLAPDKCYAFVEYKKMGDAKEAIKQLNRRRFHGLELKVELTKYKRNDGTGKHIKTLVIL